MCLDPLHRLGIGIRNRAVVIYSDDPSCTHPGPFWLTPGMCGGGYQDIPQTGPPTAQSNGSAALIL